MQASHDKSATGPDDVAIDLEGFLPYRLSVLSNTVSSAIAGAYARRFGLTIPEWRIIAVLGRFPHIAAREVAEKTAMDKVAVSRAVNRLRSAGLVDHEIAAADRRRSVLALSEPGQALLCEIAPMAMAYEARLLEGFNQKERLLLEKSLLKLMKRASEIGPIGEEPPFQAPSSVRTE
ncbi:MAG: winged helix-turn-helix transcriptional regulator [Gammaproteobacteria bacterium]|nr:winged helix-turn-helix transcriptional regulator [Gammaproteobacteria bacterium]